ncbi:MAG: photosystem I reaction center subunit XI [Cyanobacteria bacterium P01_F01_bin.143]
MDAIQHGGDPQVGNLATPLNSSDISKAFIQNLPAYRAGLSPLSRGLEVGMAHGYFVYGPLAVLGPLRGTESAETAGVLAAIGLISILTIALSLYSSAMGGAPVSIVTAPDVPEEFGTKKGWSEFATGFFLGGCGGAAFAYILCLTPYMNTLQGVFKAV